MLRRSIPYWANGKRGSKNFLLPNEVANLSIWYDVSDLSTITKDGGTGAVSQLDDKSGNLKHLTQATSGSQPIWTANQFKGFDVIRFTAGNSHHLSNLTNTIQANDFFAVIKPLSSGPNNGTMYSSFTQASSSNYFSCYWFLTGTYLQTNSRFSTSFVLNDNVITDTDGGTIMNNYQINVGNSKINTSQKTDFILSGLSESTARAFALGRLRTVTTALYGSFDFLELFAYTTPVSDDDRVKLWQYLSDKYSLTKPTL
jgi:hypothetical protein